MEAKQLTVYVHCQAFDVIIFLHPLTSHLHFSVEMHAASACQSSTSTESILLATAEEPSLCGTEALRCLVRPQPTSPEPRRLDCAISPELSV